MQKEEVEIKQIKDIVNKIIKNFVYTPWCVYTKFATQNETDVVVCAGNEVIKLKARTYQDYYFNELVERARLDIDIFTAGEEKGEHLYMESQYDSMSILLEKLENGAEIKPPKEYMFIENVVATFYEISCYHKKLEELSKESPDISPDSPREKLSHKFYNTEWEI